MSDEATPTPAPPAEVTPPAGEGAKPTEGAKPDEPLGEGGTKALAAERTRASEAERKLAEATAKLKEIEDRDKSAEDKAAERLAEAEKKATETEARANRAEVAAATSIPVDILAGPKSSSPEDITAFADAVTAYVTEASKVKGPVIPGQGKQPESSPVPDDDWLRASVR